MRGHRAEREGNRFRRSAMRVFARRSKQAGLHWRNVSSRALEKQNARWRRKRAEARGDKRGQIDADHWSARLTSVKAFVISAALVTIMGGQTVEPEMTADRPGFRNSTHLVGPGVVQLENGLVLSRGADLTIQSEFGLGPSVGSSCDCSPMKSCSGPPTEVNELESPTFNPASSFPSSIVFPELVWSRYSKLLCRAATGHRAQAGTSRALS